MKRLLWLWLPVAGWCGLIFWVSSIPGLNTGWGLWDLVLRKLAHVTEYAVLAALLFRAFGGGRAPSRDRLLWLSCALAVLYAVTDELHQRFVPGRTPALADVVIDAAGAVLFCWLRRRTGALRPGLATPSV